MNKDVIDAIPAGRAQTALAVLAPGITTGSQDVGGTNTLGFQSRGHSRRDAPPTSG